MKNLLLFTLILFLSVSVNAQIAEKVKGDNNIYNYQKGGSGALYEQMTGATTTGLISVEYSDMSDCKTGVADDFIVTGNGWDLSSIEVQGFPSSGALEPVSFTIRIFEDNSGMPSTTALYTQSGLSYSSVPTGTASLYTIPLSSNIQLDAGTYWIQVLGHNTSANRWNWIFAGTTVYNEPAYIEDPCNLFGGFGWTTVISLVSGQRDAVFAIYGTEVQPTPISNWPLALGVVFIIMILFIRYYRAKLRTA
jgi:hypothetical protein